MAIRPWKVVNEKPETWKGKNMWYGCIMITASFTLAMLLSWSWNWHHSAGYAARWCALVVSAAIQALGCSFTSFHVQMQLSASPLHSQPSQSIHTENSQPVTLPLFWIFLEAAGWGDGDGGAKREEEKQGHNSHSPKKLRVNRIFHDVFSDLKRY